MLVLDHKDIGLVIVIFVSNLGNETVVTVVLVTILEV